MHTFNVLRLFIVLGAVCLLSAANAKGAPFQNGDFESPAEPGANFIPLTFPFDGIPVITLPGWSATATTTGDSNLQNFLLTASYDHIPSGGQAALLNGDGAATTTLSQTFDTTPGTAYSVSFILTAQTLGINADGTTFSPAHVLVQASGAGNAQQSYLATGVPVNNVFPNLPYTYSFTAQDPESTLTFTQSDGSEASPILDAVQVTAVPEPASLAVAAAGLIAALARRPRRPL